MSFYANNDHGATPTAQVVIDDGPAVAVNTYGQYGSSKWGSQPCLPLSKNFDVTSGGTHRLKFTAVTGYNWIQSVQ